ncbi:MAG: hypothetical protein GVY13_02210, partial [Alphaproteobacteria bacterium]|nr:hypothetical protein [Alphaproteobacteria bacterium]
MALLAALASAAWPAGAEAGEVRGWNFGHYGRLVFDTGNPVDYRIENDGDRLVVLFDAPIDPNMAVSLAGAADRLSSFLGRAEVDAAGRRVVLTPIADLRVNDFATDSGVAIDIWFADPNGAPETAEAGDADGPPPQGGAQSGARLSLAPPAAMADQPAAPAPTSPAATGPAA